MHRQNMKKQGPPLTDSRKQNKQAHSLHSDNGRQSLWATPSATLCAKAHITPRHQFPSSPRATPLWSILYWWAWLTQQAYWICPGVLLHWNNQYWPLPQFEKTKTITKWREQNGRWEFLPSTPTPIVNANQPQADFGWFRQNNKILKLKIRTIKKFFPKSVCKLTDWKYEDSSFQWHILMTKTLHPGCSRQDPWSQSLRVGKAIPSFQRWREPTEARKTSPLPTLDLFIPQKKENIHTAKRPSGRKVRITHVCHG